MIGCSRNYSCIAPPPASILEKLLTQFKTFTLCPRSLPAAPINLFVNYSLKDFIAQRERNDIDKKNTLAVRARVLVTIKLCESSAWLLSLQLLDGYFINVIVASLSVLRVMNEVAVATNPSTVYV